MHRDSSRIRVVPVTRRGSLAAAAAVIERGGVLAFPTETVYGLGVRADDPAAHRRLRRLKRRTPGAPFQRLVSGADRAMEMCGRWPDAAAVLARAFWPGPLTMVIRARRGGWIGFRVPDHTVSLALLRRVGGCLVATSANISGHPPARDAAGVLRQFPSGIDMVLDGGPVPIGRASTVVRIYASGWAPIREGAIPLEKIRALLGRERRIMRRSR